MQLSLASAATAGAADSDALADGSCTSEDGAADDDSAEVLDASAETVFVVVLTDAAVFVASLLLFEPSEEMIHQSRSTTKTITTIAAMRRRR